jgi:hypothetical protein
MSFSTILLLLAASPLDSARESYLALKYAKAKNELKAVSGLSNLGRAQVLEYYELSALTAASLGEEAAAKEAFTQLLVLDPNWKLKGRVAPKVSTPYFEGKALATERGALQLSLVPAAEGGSVKVLLLGGQGLVQQIRLSIRSGDEVKELMVKAGDELAVAGDVVATALSAQQWVLGDAGPIAVSPKKVVVAEVKQVEKEPTSIETPAIITTPPVQEGPRLRPLAIGLGVGGLVVLGGAIAAGVVSSSARRSFETAERAPDGTITGLTREQALAADSTTRTGALLANIGFILGGSLLVGAVITWFVGNGPSPSASLYVGPQGFGWAGSW